MSDPNVTILNRSSKKCNGTWNGRPYELEPGASYSFPRIQAEAFRSQNLVRGSEDPRTGDTISLLGIVGEEDTSPVEQTNLIERWDRSKLPKGMSDVEIVPGRNGIFSGRDVHSGVIAKDSTFVKP